MGPKSDPNIVGPSTDHPQVGAPTTDHPKLGEESPKFGNGDVVGLV